MPEINKIAEVLYDGNQPYHVNYDNLPLINILQRIDMVNNQVDINTDILRGCAGSVGSLSNRISVALQEDGKLKPSAVDASLHNIGAHSDGTYDGVEYVRMTQDERDKLSLVGSSANFLQLEIEDPISNENIVDHIVIENGLVKFHTSDTVAFQFIPPNIIKAHSLYPPSAAHVHNYQIVPAHSNPGDPDYINYITTSVNTPFKEGSLRVYINGFRIGTDGVKVLVGDDPSVALNWVEYYIDSSSYETGEFSLNTSITSNDVILIDFDQNLS